jgi:mRNA interferase MazF
LTEAPSIRLVRLSLKRQNCDMTTTPRKILTSTPAMKAAAASRPAPVAANGPVSVLWRGTRVGEVYWCDFSPLNLLPEFDAMHLVVIVRGGKKDKDIHMVLPLTKADQAQNPHAHKLRDNPNPESADQSWAVCNHLYAVASERLRPLRDGKGEPRKPEKLSSYDLEGIAGRVRKALHTFLLLGIPTVEEGVPGAFGSVESSDITPEANPLDLATNDA